MREHIVPLNNTEEEMIMFVREVYKLDSNFGHAALNSELADGCKDYE